MDLKLVVLLVVGSLTLVLGEKDRFDNYKVYKVTIQNEKQLDVLQKLENFADGVSLNKFLVEKIDRIMIFFLVFILGISCSRWNYNFFDGATT